MSSRTVLLAALMLVPLTAGHARADFWSDLRETVGLARKQAEAQRAVPDPADSGGADAAAGEPAPAAPLPAEDVAAREGAPAAAGAAARASAGGNGRGRGKGGAGAGKGAKSGGRK